MLIVEKLLSSDQVAEVRKLLAEVSNTDGRLTAGASGQAIKHNLQYDIGHPNYQKADQLVRQAMFDNEQYQMFAFPRKMTPVRFAKYTEGMEYGEHLDAALIPVGPNLVRADLSFTVFLAAPDTYEGGELVVKNLGVEHQFKANAGDMIVYPSGNWHRVNPVTRGTREAGVGWIQSIHRSGERRAIIHNLKLAAYEILQKEGKTPHFDRINEAVITLERMWSSV